MTESPGVPSRSHAPERVRPSRRRAVGALLDRSAAPNQAVVSSTSLCATVAASHLLDLHGLGVFASVQLVLLLGVGLSRSAFSVPAMLEGATGHPVAEVRGRVLGGGAVAVVVAGIVAAVTAGAAQEVSLAVAAAVLPAVYWDAVRVHFQSERRFARLLAGDLVAAAVTTAWIAAAVVGAAVPSGTVLALGLGLGPLVAACVLLTPWSAAWSSWRRPWPTSITRNFAGDFTVSVGVDYALVLAGGVLLSLAAVGGLRLAQAVFGPVTVLMLAVDASLLPVLRDQPGTVRDRLRVALRWFGRVALAAILLGVALAVLPVDVGVLLLGEGWAVGAGVVGAIAARQAALCMASAGSMALATSRRSGTVLWIRLSCTPVVVAVALSALAAGGLGPFVWSLAVVYSVMAGLLCAAAWRAGAQLDPAPPSQEGRS